MWQNSKPQILTKLKKSNCDETKKTQMLTVVIVTVVTVGVVTVVKVTYFS